MGAKTFACCKSFVVTVNFVVLLVSLAITAVAAWVVYLQYNEGLLTDSSLAWLVWVPLALGIILIIVSTIGCCVTMKEKRCCTGFYGSLQFFFGVIIVLVGAVILLYVGYMETISTTAAGSLEPGLAGTQQYFSDYTIGSFETCCGVQFGNLASCESNDTLEVCIWDENAYAAGVGVDSTTCSAVDSLNLCPALPVATVSSLKVYQSNLYDHFDTYLWPSAIAFIIFSVLLLLAAIGSCYMACRKRPSPRPESPTKPSSGGKPQYAMTYV